MKNLKIDLKSEIDRVKQLKEINSSNQKGEISTIIYHYFSSKLNLPYSNIDGLKIKEILNGNLRDDVFQKN